MKYKFTGDQATITIRGVTFERGKAVTVNDVALANKLDSIPAFSRVKRGPKANANKK